MTLTPALVRWLQTAEAAPWLDPLTQAPPKDGDLLHVLGKLRQALPADKASAIVTTARLRRQAAVKFPQAERMFFAKEALAQASAAAVAAHTARRFQDFVAVADLGCGLGGDSLALADTGVHVLAVDRSRLRLALVAANARALALADAITPVCADICKPAWRLDAAWADPGRRRRSRRLFDPEELEPPLSSLLSLRRSQTPSLGIKLMPGLPHDAIPPEAEAEWISLNGELKECVLWFGDLTRKPGRRASLLPAGVEILASGAEADVEAPGVYLYEPDPAVIRAGAVSDLAISLGLWRLDPDIAYLSGDALIPTPFARCWRILERHPFGLKQLNRRLRVLQGRVIAVKKRGSPIEPEAFRKRLHSHPQGQPLVVVLTRLAGKPHMLICSPPLKA